MQHSAPFTGGCVYYGFQFVFFFIGHDGVFVYVGAIFHLGVWAMGRMGFQVVPDHHRSGKPVPERKR